MEEYFVPKGSIVRKIWGKADTLLFIFAGAAAEFALNKAVDWLYFTGRLPAYPLGRLFSTVTYSRQIIFSKREEAISAIDKITAIHKGVEHQRGSSIPDWAYRDVLFLLIDYSIRSFELLERKLTESEKAEIFMVFQLVGQNMQLTGLPADLKKWEKMRDEHLEQDLIYSDCTADLYLQYEKHLGTARFMMLKQVQSALAPIIVKEKLRLDSDSQLFRLGLNGYKLLRNFKLERGLKNIMLPGVYREKIKILDVENQSL